MVTPSLDSFFFETLTRIFSYYELELVLYLVAADAVTMIIAYSFSLTTPKITP
jgi:hypothetical protein